jgi:hypothetical protein
MRLSKGVKKMKYILNDGKYDIATITLSEKSDWFEGNLITHNGWLMDGTPCEDSNLFMADFIIKWDGCSHWYFHGEDHINDGEKDSYYHLCGASNYIQHIACLWFAWKCAENFYTKSDKWSCFDEVGGMDEFNPLFDKYKITEC